MIIGACGGSAANAPSPAPVAPAPAPAPAPDPEAALQAELHAQRDASCACDDRVCFDRRGDDHRAWAADHEAALASPSMQSALDEYTSAIAVCGGRFLSPADQAVEEFRASSVAMCRCTDKACADAVNQALEQKMERYRDVKGTEEQARALEPIMKRYMDCSMRAYGDQGP